MNLTQKIASVLDRFERAPEDGNPIDASGNLRGGTRKLQPRRYGVRCSVRAARIADALDSNSRKW